MSRYLDLLVGIILVSLLFVTWILPIDYINTTISELGLFMETPIIHAVLSLSIFIGGGITMWWWSLKKKSMWGMIYTIAILIYTFGGFPFFEWIAFWILSIWTIMRLIKND